MLHSRSTLLSTYRYSAKLLYSSTSSRFSHQNLSHYISQSPINARTRAFSGLSDREMVQPMRVTFLGSSSGGGPSESRNCSSLVVDLLGSGELWMVDAAEGTLRQFSLQPRTANPQDMLKVRAVKKIFITHMHADHVMGIITLLRSILFAPKDHVNIPPPKIEIYGPAGIRNFIRTTLRMTLTQTSDTYVVHELLTINDEPTPCEPPGVRHTSEHPGRDILCDEDGYWRHVTSAPGVFGQVVVDAGPIQHRDPCMGYVFYEPDHPKRKVVILGDTYDPSPIVPLATSASLVVHEATDAYIPPSVDRYQKRTPELVLEKCALRGHSTPEMAGAFAQTVEAKGLVLNHIGSRFPAPRTPGSKEFRSSVMTEIERQASESWAMGEARAAFDFMTVVIPDPAVGQPSVTEGLGKEKAGNSSNGGSRPKRQRR